MGLGPAQRLKAEDLYLDLGAGSAAAVAALGVRMLDPVTWIKGLTELSGGLAQGRSLDDRFGCLALVELAKRLHASPPPLPTVIAWTVQEEVGLRGARALAARFDRCTEVIAVDSFTIGMGPRDNRQFDSVRMGAGPALRAWDATTLMPDEAREAVSAAAAAAGVVLQYGHMPGGNDASVWEACASAHGGPGARVYGLGIPVQYSHSNVERANIGDLAALIGLLAALSAAA
jgi:endoglucanase